MLAVMALIAIAIAIGIPIINEQVRMAEVRAAADDLVLHLRVARRIAVTQHRTVRFFVVADPSYFEYEFKIEGNKIRRRKIDMPGRVRIATTSDPLIIFKDDGSVAVASSIILESDVSGARERWTASVDTMGSTKLTHLRVN